MRLFNHVTGTKSETDTQISQSLFPRQSIRGPFTTTLMAAPRKSYVSAMYVVRQSEKHIPISKTLSNATQPHSNGTLDVLIRGRKSSARALITQCQPMDETLVSASRTYRATKANKRQLSKTINIEVAGAVQQLHVSP